MQILSFTESAPISNREEVYHRMQGGEDEPRKSGRRAPAAAQPVIDLGLRVTDNLCIEFQRPCSEFCRETDFRRNMW
jgi:hypothetical protein